MYENIEGKKEIAVSSNFSFSLNVFFFFSVSINFPSFLPHLKLLSANPFKLRQPKDLSPGSA